MDAAFDRPAVTMEKLPVSIAGYLETNTIYSVEEGETEGVNNPRGKPTRHLEEYIFQIDENHPFSNFSLKIPGKPRGIKPNRD